MAINILQWKNELIIQVELRLVSNMEITWNLFKDI